MLKAPALFVLTISLLAGFFIDSVSFYRSDDTWCIVRQKTNDHYRIENYGYLCAFGTIHAGFSSRDAAVAAMKEERKDCEVKFTPRLNPLRGSMFEKL